MATHDRYILEPTLELEPVTPTPKRDMQGELFARIALRQLPVFKSGPEDEWQYTPTKLH